MSEALKKYKLKYDTEMKDVDPEDVVEFPFWLAAEWAKDTGFRAGAPSAPMVLESLCEEDPELGAAVCTGLKQIGDLMQKLSEF